MPAELGNLTLDDFSPLVGTAFRVDLGDKGSVQLTLVEVRDLGAVPRPPQPGPGERTRAFAVYFRGDRALLLPQRTYLLTQETLGPLSIFIVPIGPDQSGMRYEAIFN